MDGHQNLQIVSGISITPMGRATVDPSVTDLLFNLAIELDDATDWPVDVEHVLAALVLASRSGELNPNVPLESGNPELTEMLMAHMKTVFQRFGGKVGSDD